MDDVTSTRLTMRLDIEKKIEEVIVRAGFRRVSAEQCLGSSIKEAADAITAWNRELHLYERIQSGIAQKQSA